VIGRYSFIYTQNRHDTLKETLLILS
jgi:hypothetical protein